MGCDIHLYIEAKPRINPNDNYKYPWSSVGFHGEFSSRIYGMFARMANVRSSNKTYKVQFEPRGLPKDVNNYSLKDSAFLRVTNDNSLLEQYSNYCSLTMAEQWVNLGVSKWVDETKTHIFNPDYHSFSWLTTQELRQCFDDCFKEEDGTYKPYSDYSDWLGLVSLCEGIESDGKTECRVVFYFDN